MTITYSLEVANTRFFGFAKLLKRWKGSIYKILWKEFLVFALGYTALSVTYRLFLDETQRRQFEKWVLYFESFIDLIPLSFVLGFYLSLIIGRWWQQFDAIPWPDRMSYMIGIYVQGADERSRLIRRTLGRYLILLQAITFQSVSIAVKRRFPTSQHLVSAGIMTKEERTIYEQVEAPYGKWWLPAQWFSALATRAKKEGRIKDPILLDGLFRELNRYRNCCESMFHYDWISVPLVYTQVVTLATYTYALSLLVGRQYLDPKQQYDKHKVDLYVPLFTLLQFLFYVGWLKVAEQIINPYGEDDDDFDLSRTIDRSCHIVHLLVDHMCMKHPKLRKDIFWDKMLPQLPQTKISAKYIKNPQLGSAFNLEVNPADAEFLPMDTLLEEDSEANMYPSDTIKQSAGVRYRPSFLGNIFNSHFLQNMRRRSTKPEIVSQPQGHVNPAFTPHLEKFIHSEGTPTGSRKSSMEKNSSTTRSRRSSSISIHPSNISKHRHVQQAENNSLPRSFAEGSKSGDIPDHANEANSSILHMPPISEEPPRVVPAVSLKHVDVSNDSPWDESNDVQGLVAEASNVLEQLNKVVSCQGQKNECEFNGHEPGFSSDNDDSSENDSDVDLPQDALSDIDYSSAAIDKNRSTLDHHDDTIFKFDM